MALPTSTGTKKPKDPNRKPVAPRVFFMIYKGSLEGEPTITFDKMEAMDRLLSANEAGDTTLKMKKMTVPKSTRTKSAPSNGGTLV